MVQVQDDAILVGLYQLLQFAPEIQVFRTDSQASFEIDDLDSFLVSLGHYKRHGLVCGRDPVMFRLMFEAIGRPRNGFEARRFNGAATYSALPIGAILDAVERVLDL